MTTIVKGIRIFPSPPIDRAKNKEFVKLIVDCIPGMYLGNSSILAEFLWFHLNIFGSIIVFREVYKSVQEFQLDYESHLWIFQQLRRVRYEPNVKWIRGALSDPDFAFWPGMLLCINYSAERGKEACIGSKSGQYHVMTVEKTSHTGEHVIIHGTVQGVQCDVALEEPTPLFDDYHIAMAILFTRCWKIKGKEQYRELLRCLDSPEFYIWTRDRYFERNIITTIIRDFLFQ
jgi:hypothetical protein